MLSKKIFLSAALVSMAGFVACGDDSSSNSGDDKLPEKVKTIKDATSLKCDESVKCAKVFVEEEMVNDYFQCDGTQWQPATDAKFKDLCPAKEDNKTEGDENGEGDDNKTPESSAGEASSTDSGDGNDNTGSSSSTPAENNDDSSSSEGSANTDESSSSTAASTNSGSGAMVSCDISGQFGECIEYPAGSDEASQLAAMCESTLEGTLGTGCSN